MSSKELQRLNNQLDKLNRKFNSALDRNDQVIADIARKEIVDQQKKINQCKSQRERKVYQESQDIKQMAFNRPLTKAEQADLGKLKKSVKGLIVVHPLTATGKQMGLTAVTGFASREF